MTDALLSQLLAALDLAVLEPANGDDFVIRGQPPAWLPELVPDAARGSVVRPQDRMPFLANFLVDAEAAWSDDEGVPLRSGPWVEHADGAEYHLEATALRVNGTAVLLLECLGDAYREQRALVQRARQSLLDQEILEERVRERTATIRFREEEIALRLVAAAESRDIETGAHIRRIGIYSAMLAKVLGGDEEFAEDLRLAALMHDVGKIGVPDRVLRKPGPLTREERALMRRHTVIGAAILEGSDVPVLQLAREIALAHHEHWDGGGYPHGFRGAEIGLGARIVAVADVYDALVTDRVYRPALPVDETLNMMHELRARQFDPDIFDAFLELQPSFVRIHRRVSASDAPRVHQAYG